MRWLWWFVIVPVLDLILLTRIGRSIGGTALAIWLCVAAAIGFLVIRARGSRSAGDRPQPLSPRALLSRALTIAAGLLFIFPGPLSDGLALLLILPAVRRRVLGGVPGEEAARRRAPATEEYPEAHRAKDVEFTAEDGRDGR